MKVKVVPVLLLIGSLLPAAALAGSSVQLTVAGDLVSWNPVTGAIGYDVVRGDPGILHNSGGDFSLATRACLANDLVDTFLLDPDRPAPGQGFWYVVREVTATGAGSYDSGDPSQVGSRDAGIAASGRDCAVAPLALPLFFTTTAPEPENNPALGAESVYLGNGQTYLERVDLAVPGRGGAEFVFKRTYKSYVQYDGPLGFGWQHNYDMRLRRIDASTLEWLTGTDRAEIFTLRVDGTYASPGGFFVTLLQDASGLSIREPDGTRYLFNAFSDPFAPGYLAQVRDRHGNRLLMQYGTSGVEYGKLVRVQDAYDRAYTFAYDAGGRLATLQDFSGRAVVYRYSSHGDLIKVTSPVILTTTTGGPLVPEDQFPAGTSEIYFYTFGNADPRLDHKMTLVVAPNEAGAVPDGSLEDAGFLGPLSRVENTWVLDPLSLDAGRLVGQRVGGTNAQGPAGGTYMLAYAPVIPPGLDPINDEVLQVTVTDRVGDLKDTFLNVAGQGVRYLEYANRNVRPRGFGEPGTDPDVFTTAYLYNADGLRTNTTLPQNNRITLVYDSASPSRCAQANLLSRTLTPDGRGDSRGGFRTRVVTFRYEPVYNQVRASTDERGNEATFTPQNGGANSAARFTTTRFFDYQQTGTLAALSAETGLDTTTLSSLLAASGTALGLGDLNADPSDDAFLSGDVVKVAQPTVTLVANQTREIAALGSTSQAIVTLVSHNRYGQTTRTTDPEKNVSSFTYFSSSDPDGDGTPVAGTTQTDTTGGYLATTSVDTTSAAGRDSGQDPPPANVTTSMFYDAVGNVVRTLDPRGIEHLADYNSLNQVVRTLAASSTGYAYLPRDLALPALGYESLTIYDANNNVTETRTGNQGERDGTGAFVATNPYWTTKNKRDILDRTVTTIQEVTPIANDGSITETSPGVLVTTFTHDANENTILVTKPEGNSVATTYDERDLVFTVTRGFGTVLAATTKTHYDLNGNPTYQIDAVKNNTAKNTLFPEGDVTLTNYDGFDRKVSTVSPELERRQVVYDPSSNAVRSVNYGSLEEGTPRIAESSTLHDELGRPFRTNSNLIAFSVFSVIFDRSIPTITANTPPLGDTFAVSLGEYDALGRSVRTVGWKGDESLSDYDGAGRVVRAQSPVFMNSAGTASARNEMQYGHDGASNVILTTRIDRSPLTGVAAETFLTDTVYDGVGRVVRKSDSLNNTTRNFYDSRGNVIATTDARSSAMILDPLALRGGAPINNNGNPTRVFYDGISRPVRTERLLKIGGQGDGDPNLTTDTSLDLSNPTIPTGIATTRTFFDGNSRVTGMQDSNGNATSSAFDALDRPITVTFADLTTSQTGYDADGHATQTTDPNGSAIQRTYDGDGRPLTIRVTNRATNLAGTGQNVLGTTLQAFEWDGLSRLRGSIDDNGAPATLGVAYNPVWDSLNRKTSERHRINASVAANNVMTTNNRLVVTVLAGTLDRTVTSGYTPPVAGTVMPVRTTIGYPATPLTTANQNITLTVDGLDRVTTIFGLNSTTFRLANYDWIGKRRPIQRDTPTEVTTWVYDQHDSYPIDLKHICKSGENHAEFAYTFDNEYNRNSEQRLDMTLLGQPTNQHSYDSFNRGKGVNYGVVGTNPPTSTTSYTIDGAQNFATRVEGGVTMKFNANGSGVYVPNVLNEYTSVQTFDAGGALISTDTPVHDAAGNQIQGGQRHVFYDALNRVVRVDRSFDGGTTYRNVGNYTYTADGRRVTKGASVYDGSGTLMRIDNLAFICDGNQEIQEWDQGTPTLQSLFVWGGTDVGELGPTQQITRGRVFFAHGDAQYSTAVLTDGVLGNSLERYEYTNLYGKHVVHDAGPVGGIGAAIPINMETGNPYRFQGQRFDDESGLYYFHNRYLDPDNGRFLSRDPIGVWGDSGNLGNPYAFVGNNPFNRRDPLGLATTGERWKDVSGLDAPTLEFTSGEPYRMQLDLFFDAYEERRSAGGAAARHIPEVQIDDFTATGGDCFGASVQCCEYSCINTATSFFQSRGLHRFGRHWFRRAFVIGGPGSCPEPIQTGHCTCIHAAPRPDWPAECHAPVPDPRCE